MAHYVGILDGAGTTWGVRIPDFPGCHGGGATPEAALTDAVSALREVAAQRLAHGGDISEPRGMRAVVADPATDFDAANEAIVLVPLLLDRGRPMKANISLDAGLLETIDAEASRRGLTRSSFLASAAAEKIERFNELGEASPRARSVRPEGRAASKRRTHGKTR